MVFVGGAEDHGDIDVNLLKDVEAAAVGELDVHEQEVDPVGGGPEELDGAFDAVTDPEDGVGIVDREDEFLQEFRCTGFIFDDQDVHGCSSWRVTENLVSVFWMLTPSRIWRSSYRLRRLSRPMPEDSSAEGLICRLFSIRMRSSCCWKMRI